LPQVEIIAQSFRSPPLRTQNENAREHFNEQVKLWFHQSEEGKASNQKYNHPYFKVERAARWFCFILEQRRCKDKCNHCCIYCLLYLCLLDLQTDRRWRNQNQLHDNGSTTVCSFPNFPV